MIEYDVVTQAQKGDPRSKTLKIYHRSCFEDIHGMHHYNDPNYWTYQRDSEEWSRKPTCAACGQSVQRKQEQ